MPDPFGGFGWICRHTPAPQCNLFFSQLWNSDQSFSLGLLLSGSDFYAPYYVNGQSVHDDPNVQAARADSGTGVRANCMIPHGGHRGSVGDVALIVIASISVLLAVLLLWHAGRRKAAVGRIEIQSLLFVYGLHTALSVVTMSSLLEQGSKSLAVLSSIHIAVIVVLFWILLGNAIIATQFVEDGTPAALVPLALFAVLFFIPTLYIGLDTSLGFSDAFVLPNNIQAVDLKSIGLFCLTLLWPALAALLYLVIMVYVSLGILNEVKPAMLYLLAGLLFAAGQLIFFLASQPLCNASHGKVNGAFLSVLLDTAALGTIYWAWQTITEDDWE